ncbi:MAG TPA: hypothetical protein VI524_01460 [Anaerolineales bacterium]|nr:hypothetical protein [Anaerolineales bacterium]
MRSAAFIVFVLVILLATWSAPEIKPAPVNSAIPVLAVGGESFPLSGTSLLAE